MHTAMPSNTKTDMAAASEGEQAAPPERAFSDGELELARAGYEQNRKYVYIDPGMINQVMRNGLLTKKTRDGDGYIRMFDSEKYYRDQRSTTPDGSTIIHEYDADPHPGNCKAFIHPPYDSYVEYRGENDMKYGVRLNLPQLAIGATTCSFCSILYEGIQSKRKFWILNWAKYKWLDSHTLEEWRASSSEMPWIDEFADEVVQGKDIDENDILLYISFPRGSPYVELHLMVSAHPSNPNKRGRGIGDLELYTKPGNPSGWKSFGPAPHIYAEVLSDECIDRIRSWISYCKDNHSDCTTAAKGKPSRLLRLNIGDEDQLTVSLEDTEPDKEYEYVALSHVWLFTTPLRTTKENLSQHYQIIPWEDLSEGLAQSIILTACLDISYIWIDSLCIIQDSPEDWLSESPRMGLIYNSAAIVFAAHGPELGFQKTAIVELRDPDPSRVEDNPVYARQKIAHKNVFSAPDDTDSWFGRGWCLQERFFAPRILHFGGYCEELFFECNTHTTCECSRINDDHPKQKVYTMKSRLAGALTAAKAKPKDVETLDDLWRAYILACEDYTARGLTYTSDTLPAISSLMSQFSLFFGRFYAGMWEYHFILSLQWEVLDTQYCHRHKEYVAPSWSWAARSGAAIWYLSYTSLESLVPTPETHDFASITSISSTLAGVDPFGKVSAAQLVIKGYVTHMKIISTELDRPDGRMEMRKEGMDGKGEECYVTFDAVEDSEETTVGEKLICLDVLRDKDNLLGNFVSALVLRQVESLGEVVYKRVGFSTMKVEHFADSERVEVTII